MFKIKKYFLATFVILFSFFAVNAFAYKFDFVTVSDVVNNIKKNYSNLESYQANFSIVSDKGRKENDPDRSPEI